MSDPWIEEQIAKLADKGRARVKNGALFGMPIDPDNIQHVYAALEALADLPPKYRVSILDDIH